MKGEQKLQSPHEYLLRTILVGSRKRWNSTSDCVAPNLPNVILLVARQNRLAHGLQKMLTTLWVSSFSILQTMLVFPRSPWVDLQLGGSLWSFHSLGLVFKVLDQLSHSKVKHYIFRATGNPYTWCLSVDACNHTSATFLPPMEL